jgi:hypothetical protein
LGSVLITLLGDADIVDVTVLIGWFSGTSMNENNDPGLQCP